MESKNHSNPQWLRACSTQIHASHQGRMIKIKTAVCKLLLETRFQSNPSLVFNWILLYSSQKVNDVEKDSSKLQPFSDRSYCIIYNSSILVPTGDNICIPVSYTHLKSRPSFFLKWGWCIFPFFRAAGSQQKYHDLWQGLSQSAPP